MCILESLPQVVEVFARLVLNMESDLMANDDVVEASKPSKKILGSSLLRRTAAVWEIPAGLVPVHTFALHFMPFSEIVYTNAALHGRCQHLSLSRRSEKRQALFYTMAVQVLLAIDCFAKA